MKLWSEHRSLVVFICCIAMMFAFVSCSEDDGVQPTPPAGTDPELEVTVDNQTFTISWNPKLEVNKLYVEGLAPGDWRSLLAWFIEDENGLTPPISYGQVPAGAQALRPALSTRTAAPYRATIIRSDGYDDEILASSSRSAGAVALQGPVVYMPELERTSPPGITPEVWEFTYRVMTVSSSGWGTDADLETTLGVRGALVRDLDRDEQGVQRLYEYQNYRIATEPGGDTDLGFMWDEVPPLP